MIIYGVLLFYIFLNPDNVTIDASTNWRPVWSLSFYIYLMIIYTTFCFIPTFFYSIFLYKKFEIKELRKRWKSFFIGMCGLYFCVYGTMIHNTLNDDTFRMIWSFITLSMPIWGYLMYYGVGRYVNMNISPLSK